MNNLVKSSDALAGGIVRPLPESRPSIPAAPREPPVDPLVAALREDLEEALLEIERRDKEIARLEASVDAAFVRGKEEGRKAGLKESEALRTQSLAKLDEGLKQADERFAEALSSLDRLALILARECLTKILGDPDKQMDLVCQILRDRVAKIDARSVVRIEVSAKDFSDPQDLAKLVASMGSTIDLRAVDELESGGCRIKLLLGSLELGVGQQWDRIDAALGDLAAPASEPS